MWIVCAFLSAALLGCYDVFKKHSLRGNAVIPVLFLNTLFCSLIFAPMALAVPFGGWEVQRYIVLKACIVLSSWMLGYIGMKYLPLTLVGPINATRPVMVLLGALLIFGERLNLYQWIGVVFAMLSFFLLSRSGRKEGIDFRHNRWILCTVGAAILGALSGLYDKFLLASPQDGGVGLNKLVVQSYYNFYQCLMMGVLLLMLWYPRRHKGEPFHWIWSIPLISIFLSVADYVYFCSLHQAGALVSVVSMVRRGSVVVSFMIGAFLFHEKNLRSKAVDLLLVLIGMVFLFLGTSLTANP
ncbi:MAG: DMT family transporter [Bacteroidaceae bacterium]|nr:DMT family transporter [Bacteroidaceae bacterium]